jgi:hypothetical protein
MRIAPDLIEQARGVPLHAVAAGSGLKLRRVGRELAGPCPVCGGTDRFSIHTAKRAFHCRGCGAGGRDAIVLTMHLQWPGFPYRHRNPDWRTTCAGVTQAIAPCDLDRYAGRHRRTRARGGYLARRRADRRHARRGVPHRSQDRAGRGARPCCVEVSSVVPLRPRRCARPICGSRSTPTICSRSGELSWSAGFAEVICIPHWSHTSPNTASWCLDCL